MCQGPRASLIRPWSPRKTLRILPTGNLPWKDFLVYYNFPVHINEGKLVDKEILCLPLNFSEVLVQFSEIQERLDWMESSAYCRTKPPKDLGVGHWIARSMLLLPTLSLAALVIPSLPLIRSVTIAKIHRFRIFCSLLMITASPTFVSFVKCLICDLPARRCCSWRLLMYSRDQRFHVASLHFWRYLACFS